MGKTLFLTKVEKSAMRHTAGFWHEASHGIQPLRGWLILSSHTQNYVPSSNFNLRY